MPKLKAGRTTVDLTQAQMDKLGLAPRAELLGCGTQACAYVGRDPETVVKLTNDIQDAMTSYILMSVPEAGSGWAIPIYDVFQVNDDAYVIVSARAEKLPKRWAEAIDLLFNFADATDVGLDPEEWDQFYELLHEQLIKARSGQAVEFKLDGAELDVAASDVTTVRHALEVMNDATLGFRNVGYSWVDSHAGNWGIYHGKPVVIDLGMSFNTERPPVEQL